MKVTWKYCYVVLSVVLFFLFMIFIHNIDNVINFTNFCNFIQENTLVFSMNFGQVYMLSMVMLIFLFFIQTLIIVYLAMRYVGE